MYHLWGIGLPDQWKTILTIPYQKLPHTVLNQKGNIPDIYIMDGFDYYSTIKSF